ncbi:hypothetical protein JCM8208_005433 [Rhodotorula glutinis]
MPPTLRPRKPDRCCKSPDWSSGMSSTASTSEEDERDSGTDEDDDKPAPVPHKKRKKAAARSTKVRSTGNDVFSTIPLDLLYQICGDLDPDTPLAISQVSKPIHRTLASKSAADLWKHVRRSSGLSDLSVPLSEPKYAALVQGSTCQHCGLVRSTTKGLYELRVRACPKCISINLKSLDTIWSQNKGIHRSTFEAALSTTKPQKYSTAADPVVYWLPEVLAVSKKLQLLDPGAALSSDPTRHPSLAATMYVGRRREYVVRVKEDAEKIRQFEKDNVARQQQEDDEKRGRRYQQLCRKVIAAGFSERDCSGIPQWTRSWTRPLTDQEWDDVGPHVLEDVAAARELRLAKELVRAQTRRKVQLQPLYSQLYANAPSHEQSLWPRLSAFYDLPAVAVMWKPQQAVVDPNTWPLVTPAILAQVDRDISVDRLYCFDMVARSLLAAGATLPVNVKRALQLEASIFLDVDDESKGLAPLHAKVSARTIDDILQRPTALLSCTACGCTRPYPAALAHLKRKHYADPSATCEGVEARVITMLRECLINAGMVESTTRRSHLRALGPVFEVAVVGGRILRDLTWEQVTSGSISVRTGGTRPLTHQWDDSKYASITLNVKKMQELREAAAGAAPAAVA